MTHEISAAVRRLSITLDLGVFDSSLPAGGATTRRKNSDGATQARPRAHAALLYVPAAVMSKPAEGVSRWAQRKAAKAQMYATSTEQQGGNVASRRMQQTTDSKYVPRTGEGWSGKAWGLASTKVQGRQNAQDTRFSSGSRRGELYYGERRKLSTVRPSLSRFRTHACRNPIRSPAFGPRPWIPSRRPRV